MTTKVLSTTYNVEVQKTKLDQWSSAQWQKHTTCQKCWAVTHCRRTSKRAHWRCFFCFCGVKPKQSTCYPVPHHPPMEAHQ